MKSLHSVMKSSFAMTFLHSMYICVLFYYAPFMWSASNLHYTEFFTRTKYFLPRLHVFNVSMILGSNVLKIVLILRVIFCKYSRNYLQHIVFKTFSMDTFQNRAMTAGVY